MQHNQWKDLFYLLRHERRALIITAVLVFILVLLKLALIGVMKKNKDRGNHLITCQTEHKAVLDTARHLESIGKKVTYLPVDEYGRVDPKKLRDELKENTLLISIMYANNEIGVIQPMKEISELCKKHGLLFMSDATQAVGKRGCYFL